MGQPVVATPTPRRPLDDAPTGGNSLQLNRIRPADERLRPRRRRCGVPHSSPHFTCRLSGSALRRPGAFPVIITASFLMRPAGRDSGDSEAAPAASRTEAFSGRGRRLVHFFALVIRGPGRKPHAASSRFRGRLLAARCPVDPDSRESAHHAQAGGARRCHSRQGEKLYRHWPAAPVVRV